MDVADLLDALEGFPVTEPYQVLPGDPETLDKRLVHVALYNVSSLLREVTNGRVWITLNFFLGPHTEMCDVVFEIVGKVISDDLEVIRVGEDGISGSFNSDLVVLDAVQLLQASPAQSLGDNVPKHSQILLLQQSLESQVALGLGPQACKRIKVVVSDNILDLGPCVWAFGNFGSGRHVWRVDDGDRDAGRLDGEGRGHRAQTRWLGESYIMRKQSRSLVYIVVEWLQPRWDDRKKKPCEEVTSEPVIPLARCIDMYMKK